LPGELAGESIRELRGEWVRERLRGLVGEQPGELTGEWDREPRRESDRESVG